MTVMTPKRCQQEELYAAERGVDHGRQFDSIEAIQVFVDGLRDERWWFAQGFWTVERIEVGRPSKRNERDGSVGWYEKAMNAGRIEMAQVHWDELTVLHEVAHVLADALHNSEAHDPYFARIYLTLVSCVMGPQVYTRLRNSFDRRGVIHDPHTTTTNPFAL